MNCLNFWLRTEKGEQEVRIVKRLAERGALKKVENVEMTDKKWFPVCTLQFEYSSPIPYKILRKTYFFYELVYLYV